MYKKIISSLLILGFLTGCETPQTSSINVISLESHRPPVKTPTPIKTAIPTPIPVKTATPKPTIAPVISTPSPVVIPSPVPTVINNVFSAPNNYPPSTWQPFASNSVWNEPFTAKGFEPVVDPNNTAYTKYYGNTYGWFNTIDFGYTPSQENNNWNPPIYFGQSTDPVYKLKCTQTWFSCPTGSYHIPSYAIPENTSDGHIIVIDESVVPAVEIDAWDASKLSGTGGIATAQVWGSGSINGNGLSLNATAAGYALSAGILKASDLTSGLPINHALFVIAPCTSNSDPVYPSNYRTTDFQCPNNGGIKYGQRGRLNMTEAQLFTYGLSAPEFAIGLALINYGFYQGDTNGGYSWTMEVENDYTYTQAGYKNSQCPTNGASCTPLTAWENSMGNPHLKGQYYQFDLSKIPFTTYVQWLLPPISQP